MTTTPLPLFASGHPDTFEGFNAEESNVANIVRFSATFRRTVAYFDTWPNSELLLTGHVRPVRVADTYALRLMLVRAESCGACLLIEDGYANFAY